MPELSDTDDESAAGGLDDFFGDGRHFIEAQDALDLHEQAMQEMEIAAS